MNLLEKYQPLIKNAAFTLSKSFGVEKADLIQEGNLVVLEIMERKDLGENPKAVSAYVKMRVIGAMKNYIAKNLGPVVVPSNAFWENHESAVKVEFIDDLDSQDDCFYGNHDGVRPGYHDFQATSFDVANKGRTYSASVGDSTEAEDPETLYLKAESEELMRRQVIAFIAELTPEERIVFGKRIVTEEPVTTRNLAKEIGVKSPQTVSNIEKRVREKYIKFLEEEVNSGKRI